MYRVDRCGVGVGWQGRGDGGWGLFSRKVSRKATHASSEGRGRCRIDN